jgi:DNA repair exonuclease SbcCD ATPase subunit
MLDGRSARGIIMEVTLEKIMIPIYKRLFYIYDQDYATTNIKTLDYINEDYYSSMQEIVDSEKTCNLFLNYSLFQNYFSSLEVMFSHLGAVLQAPYFYYPWIMEYSNRELYNIVSTINNNGILRNAHNLKNLSWKNISDIIHPNIESEFDRKRNEMFENIWRKMANDFLNKDFQEAYNSLKHGLRVKNDAIKQVQIGNCLISGSNYGIEYGIIKEINGVNILRKKIININSAIFDYAFEFIKGSMINIKNYLKSANRKGLVNVIQYQPSEDAVNKYLELEPPSISTVIIKM